jgi:hypothetical protein
MKFRSTPFPKFRKCAHDEIKAADKHDTAQRRSLEMCHGISATAPAAHVPAASQPVNAAPPAAAVSSASSRVTATDTVTISPQGQQAAKTS